MTLRIFYAFSILFILSFQAPAADRLKDKVVIITGASKGIGKGIAATFAKEGAKLVLMSRGEKDLKAVSEAIKSEGGDVIYVTGDVSKFDDLKKVAQKTLEEYGRIDVLVHNAGIYPPHPIEKMTEAQWRHVMAVNLDSAFYAVKAVLPSMKKLKQGRILFTSSISGPRTGLPDRAHYTASKAGMNGFMRTLAVELAKDNITVNAVEPGIIMTEGVAAKGEAYINGQRKSVPLGRLGTPEEVASAHVFLASDDASFITGQSIIVDGGQILPEY